MLSFTQQAYGSQAAVQHRVHRAAAKLRQLDKFVHCISVLANRSTSCAQCLVSAAANAKNNYDMKKSSLYVSTAFADMGPKMKRFRCGDRGRPKAYNKALSHITIKVAERDSTELN